MNDPMITKHYACLNDALVDALRVQDMLLAALEGQLVIPVASIEFLAKRARALTSACLPAAETMADALIDDQKPAR